MPTARPTARVFQPASTAPASAVVNAAVRLVDRRNRNRFKPQISQMHAVRKQVFVDQLKWDLPVIDGLYEADEYDRDDTIYLIVADAESGSHLGSVRLLATDGPHLLGDKFPQLCADGVPSGSDIFEITRMVTRPDLPRAVAERVREQLSVAIVEFALARDVRYFTMMTHMAFLSAVIAVGWDCEPLGMPEVMDGVAVAALRIDVDMSTLARLRAQWNFVEPVLQFDFTRSALME